MPLEVLLLLLIFLLLPLLERLLQSRRHGGTEDTELPPPPPPPPRRRRASAAPERPPGPGPVHRPKRPPALPGTAVRTPVVPTRDQVVRAERVGLVVPQRESARRAPAEAARRPSAYHRTRGSALAADLHNPRALRRAFVLLSVLGPCKALERDLERRRRPAEPRDN
jgi:hypothetical protein